MRVYICGSGGQLGIALAKTSPHYIKLNKSIIDITNQEVIREDIKNFKPDILINAAAYTDVEEAENNEITARKVNSEGPRDLSLILREIKAGLIHISTDYVFDGKTNIPYREEDNTNPLSVYGKTKQLGEIEIKNNIQNHIIFRVSKLYGPDRENCVTKILRAGLKNKSLNIVSDQFSRPTNTHDLARIIWISVERLYYNSIHTGIYHYSGMGDVVSWYDFAEKIFYYASKMSCVTPKIRAISSEEYNYRALRPQYSCLDINKSMNEFSLPNSDWTESLADTIKKILLDGSMIK